MEHWAEAPERRCYPRTSRIPEGVHSARLSGSQVEPRFLETTLGVAIRRVLKPTAETREQSRYNPPGGRPRAEGAADAEVRRF
jgi:hypothetical protein